MSLRLPKAAGSYDPGNEAATRAAVEANDLKAVKTDSVLHKLLMRDTVTGAVKTLTIQSSTIVIT